jgi:hypothetical protein
MKTALIYGSVVKSVYILSLFVSTTFAFFSDSVANDNNRVVLGNLRLSTLYSETYDATERVLTGDVVDLKTSTDPLFVFKDQSEPGDFVEGYLRIANSGSIDLDYFFQFLVVEDLNDFSSILTIDVEKVLPAATVVSLTDDTLPTLIEGEVLETDAFEIYRIRMTIMPTANDTFNDPSKVFALEMDLKIYAWQANFPDSRPSLT